MEKNKKNILLSVMSLISIIAIPILFVWFLSSTTTSEKTEITVVVEKFVKENTTVGKLDLVQNQFPNRFEYINLRKKDSAEKALKYTSENNTKFTNNLPNYNRLSEYSGALITQENKKITIKSIEVNNNKADVVFNTNVREYISYYLADEEHFDPELLNVVQTKYRDVELSDLHLHLVKENDEWKIDSSDNLMTVGSQFFSTWDGSTPTIKIDNFTLDTEKEFKYVE